MKKKVFKVLKIALFLTVIIFLLKIIVQSKNEIILNIRNANVVFLLLSLLFLSLSFFLQSFIWHLILKTLREDISFFALFEINIIASFLRYLPGGVGDQIGRYSMLSRKNMERKKIVVSISLLMGYTVISGVLLFIIVSPLPFPKFLSHKMALLFTIVIIFLVLIFVVLLPKLISFITGEKETGINHYKIITFITLCLLFWIIWGSAAFYTVMAFHPLPIARLPEVSSMGAISWVIGFLTPFAPNGAGIREVTLIYLLKTLVPYSIGVTASIFLRLIIITRDLIFGMMLILIRILHNHIFRPQSL